MIAILRKMWADIISRPLISLLVVVTVVTSSALLTLALATLLNLNAPYDRAFRELNAAHLWLFFDREVTSRRDVERIERMPGILETTGLRSDVITRVRLGKNRVWSSLRAIPLEEPGVNRLFIKEGQPLGESRGTCLASKDLDDLYGVGVGDRIEVTGADGRTSELIVTGLAYNPMWDTYRNTQPPYIYITEATLRELFPDETMWGWSLGLRLADPQGVETTLARIEAELHAEVVENHVDWRDVRESAVFGARINFIFLGAFNLFAILATILVIASSIGTIVLSQFRQIGILKTIGFTRKQVLWLYLGQYLALSAAACPIGLAIGSALSPLPLKSVAASLNTAFRPPVNTMLILVVLSVVSFVVALATLGAAYRGAKANIVRAIAVGAEAPKHPHALSRQLDAALNLPIVLQLGIKDLFAKPFRSFLTGLNLALGVVGIVFGLTLSDTLDAYRADPSLLGIFYDAAVTRDAIGHAKAMHLLSDAPGVVALYSEYLAEAETAQGKTFQIRAVEGELDTFPLRLSDGRRFQAASNEAIVGQGLLDWLDLEIGDTLNVRIKGGVDRPLAWHIVGTYPEPVNAGQMMMVSAPTLARWVRDIEPNTYFLKLGDGVDPYRMKAQLEAASRDDLNVTLVEQALPDAVRYLQVAIYALSGILIGIALINVFTSSLLATNEKVRAIGTLKTVGMTPTQVIAMINTGAGVLGAAATAVGIPIGFLLTQTLLITLSHSYGFGQVTVKLDPLTIVLLVPLMPLVSMAGSLIPSVHASRLSIVTVLRHE
ncbi:MAG: FtsX-like permease family protein [Anaerolineae bacterium]